MNRSRLNIKNQYENASSRHVEDVIDKCDWVFRRTPEKDNDIDGEIELFNVEGITTAKILKVQLKSSLELNIKDGFVIFDCPVKFLNFCDVCDIPVLLVYYGVNDKKAYWLWTQMYIFQELNVNNEDWRNNREKVRVRIPLGNEFTHCESFKVDIEKIAENGINEIQQLRKQDTSEYYYTILEEIDNSSPKNRRISAKIYVERSFASSKDALIELIKKINEKIRTSTYHKKILSGGLEQREVEVLQLYFYDDLVQYRASSPFCRTEWINPNTKNVQRTNINEPDEYLEEHKIKIKWETFYKPLQQYLLFNSVSKGEYFEKMRATISYVQKEMHTVCDLFYKQDKSEFYEYANQQKEEYRDVFLNFGDILYPPFECQELHTMIEECISILDHMTDSIYQKSGNDYYIETQFIKNIRQDIGVLNYLLKKVFN